MPKKFTTGQVLAVQWARRIAVKQLPNCDGLDRIIANGYLAELNKLLTLMEDNHEC